MKKKTQRQTRVLKNKMKEVTKDKSIHRQNRFNGYNRFILLIAVGILLFYPPYFRGLFFASEMLATHLATTAVFLLWCISSLKKKDISLNIGILDWLVLGYVVIYCLSVITALDTRQAISGALKALNYGLIYFLVAQITADTKTFKQLLLVLYASSVGVALIGIGCATGYVNYPAGFDGQNITSTLQYTNATSAYMAIMAIIGITLTLVSERFWWQILYSFSASLLMLVSVNSASKGAWLIFILALIIFLGGMPTRYRVTSVYFFLVTLAAALASSNLFMFNIQNQRPESALISLCLGFGIIIILNLLWQGLVIFFDAHGILKTAVLSITGAVFAVIAGWALIGNKAVTAFRIITGEMAQLANLQNSSFVSRWAMYSDATSIAIDHPIVGTGAGGWNLLYHQYQDIFYRTTEVHNHLLQVGVETGIPGMLIWLGLFVVLAYYIYKIRKNRSDSHGKVLIWGVGTAIFALGAHSLIDFDLSIPSLQILFFSLLGLISSAFQPYSANIIKRPKANQLLFAGIGISIAVFILAGSFLFAIFISNQGSRLEQVGNLEVALTNYQKASIFDPFNSHYHGAQARVYAQFYAAKAGDDSLHSQWFSSAVHHARLAEEKSPYDPMLMSELSRTYGLLGSYTDAIRLYERVIQLNPWNINAYNYIASLYATLAIRSLEANDIQNANKFIELALATPERIEQQAAKARTDLGAMLAPDSTTAYVLAQAHYYQGDYQTALQEMEGLLSQAFAAEDGFKTVYAAALYKNGRQAEAEQVMAETKAAKPDVYSRYLKIRDLPAIREN